MSGWPSIDDLVVMTMDRPDASARVDCLLERTFLGAVLCADALEDAWFLVGPGDFWDPLHAVIYAAALRLRARHQQGLDRVHAAVQHVPAAAERIEEIARLFIPSDGHRSVYRSCAIEIRRAALQRSAAQDRAA